MYQIRSSDKKTKMRYVDDIKSILLANRYFSYSKNIKIQNTQSRNIIFYNKNIINKEIKNISKKYNENLKIPKQVLDIHILETLIFNNISFEKIHTYRRSDKSIIDIKPKININNNKDSYIFYFTINENKPFLNFQKINDKICSIKINSSIDISNVSLESFNNNFEVNQAINKGYDLLLVEKDYFFFSPCYDLNKLHNNFRYYFDTFNCSYFYYLNTASMQIISHYYSKLNELMKLFRKNKNDLELKNKLCNLNDNTHILLKQNKLL